MIADDLERVTAMVTDHGQHWDLSEKDEAAIAAILQSHAELLEALEAAYEQIECFDAAAHNSGKCLCKRAQSAIAKARGTVPRSDEEKSA